MNIRTMNGITELAYKYLISFEEIDRNTHFGFHYVSFNNELHGIMGFGMMSYLQIKIELQNHMTTFNRNMFQINTTPDVLSRQCTAFVNTSTIEDTQFRLAHLNSEEKYSLTRTLKKLDDVFYYEGDSLSFTSKIKHRIRTKHEDPIYSKLYRYPQKYKEVDKQINDMLD